MEEFSRSRLELAMKLADPSADWYEAFVNPTQEEPESSTPETQPLTSKWHLLY